MDYDKQIEMVCDFAYNLSQKHSESLEKQIKNTGLAPDSKRAAASACKFICLFIEMYVKRLTVMNFTEFAAHCIDNGILKPLDFWLNKMPQDVLDVFVPGKKVIRVSDYDKFLELMKKEKIIGMLRIITGKDKKGNDTKHSIMCYSKKEEPWIADTSYRGVDVPARTFLSKNNFAYFEYMV